MKHVLPPLPYAVTALEPHIDARTMALHHDEHHGAYVARLNAAIEPFPELHERSATWLLLNLTKLPHEARNPVRVNAGGHVNHSLFWLARAQQNGGRLRVFTTTGHGNPLMQGHFPLLLNDVWEHAYYLKHQNRRAEYLQGWWPVVDWEEVARRFARTDSAAQNRWVAEGDLLLEAA